MHPRSRSQENDQRKPRNFHSSGSAAEEYNPFSWVAGTALGRARKLGQGCRSSAENGGEGDPPRRAARSAAGVSATRRSLYDRNQSSNPEIIPPGRRRFRNFGP